MKKVRLYALVAASLLTGGLASCNGGGSTATPSAKLNTSADSLSYAYGVETAESGLLQYLDQLGVVKDTAMISASYKMQIENEQDATKKAQLQKKYTTEIDSVNKTNKVNLENFVKGLKESYTSKDKNKEAYYNGIQLGSQLKTMGDNFGKQVLPENESLNHEALLAGLLGVLNKEEPILKDTKTILQQKAEEAQKKMMAQQEEDAKKANASTIEAGTKFLEENKTKEGVVTLPSGLQYKIIKEGKGPKPTANDQVEVFYKGTLLDGTVFDSNMGKQSIKFPVNQVIKGWTEALQLMPVGSKWELYVPSDLAYGSQAAGAITPFSTLIFEIDLVGIVK